MNYGIGMNNHEIGVDIDVELEARLVLEEVGPKKLKTREGLSNQIGFEISIMDIGLAGEPGMSTGMAINRQGHEDNVPR